MKSDKSALGFFNIQYVQWMGWAGANTIQQYGVNPKPLTLNVVCSKSKFQVEGVGFRAEC